MTDQTDVFAPPPPTGPATEVPTRAQNRYAAYTAWRRTVDGGRAWGWIRDHAANLLRLGAKRIATKALVEECRTALTIEINNTYTAWLADDLVRDDPRLLNLIERRKRRKGAA